jgi:hypothetical protein
MIMLQPSGLTAFVLLFLRIAVGLQMFGFCRYKIKNNPCVGHHAALAFSPVDTKLTQDSTYLFSVANPKPNAQTGHPLYHRCVRSGMD